MTTIRTALKRGRLAAAILEAPPADPLGGYTEDEIAAHYAATDRLLAVFRQLEAHLEPPGVQPLNT